MKNLLFLMLLPSCAFATTCSYVESIIKPISVNKKGEVLCKTFFGLNESGGSYSYDFVKYGFCILSKDSISYFPGVKLINHWDEDDFDKKVEFWDGIFNSKTSEKRLNTIVNEVLKKAYSFNEVNAGTFKKDTILTHEIFQLNYGINLNVARQKSLFNGLSNRNSCNDRIHVTYDFDGILVIENDRGCKEGFEPTSGKGCDFSYSYTSVETWGFDIDRVTGILFKN